jgi:ribosomal protein S4
MRFGNTFNEVRQLISHKHILVNDKIVTSSAFLINPGDDICVNKDSYDHVSKLVSNAFKTSLDIKEEVSNLKSKHNLVDILRTRKLMFTPNYIEINYNLLKGSFLYSPSFDEVIYPFPINLLQITQYYEHKLKI